MIKKFFKIFALLVMCLPLEALAVTQKEMEEARTIAAKAYLRYANDGSGYLDDLNPKTMEELEASLKTKEKENIKAFKAITVPADYKGWNKEKLLEYWAVTAFQNKGLLEKGLGGRIRARSQINKMTIGAPQAEEVKTTSTAAPLNVPDKPQQDSLALTELKTAEEASVDAAISLDEETIKVDKATNYTWVYIMVLAILVAIVVALVVYAANVMKKDNRNDQRAYQPEEDSETEEQYKALINDKNTEISMLKKKLETANRQNVELKTRLESVMGELAALQSVAQTVKNEEKRESMSSKPMLRTIFLGRANSRGIFVRADRNLNIGNSVFVLDTSDGYSGTFRVADSPAAWSLALSNPKEYLETACTGYNLEDTTDVSKIVTETAGTAVFEGGCWRVIRKARIKYIS